MGLKSVYVKIQIKVFLMKTFRSVLSIVVYKISRFTKKNLLSDFFLLMRFLFSWNFAKDRKIRYINKFELRIYSQNGEDGILQTIFYKIGTKNRYFVEFGVGDGNECNTRFLKEAHNWKGLWMDAKYKSNDIKKELVTKENVEKLFKKYKVPKNFDLLSIDIDGNDYWVWEAIKYYKPRVVVIEYNSVYPPPIKVAVKYDANFEREADNYFGASLSDLEALGREKGYTLIACDSNGINAFFVRSNLVKDRFLIDTIVNIYKPPKFGLKLDGKYVGYKKSKREMISI